MTPYQTLVQVLDRICAEAPVEHRTYHPLDTEKEKLNTARSRAYLHLFLKVRFGLLTFAEREALITEGAQDGGVDAYFIDEDRRVIYFLQSKFRTTEKNFEEKAIDPEELLMMDIDRMLKGEQASETGVPYNSKIRAMMRAISTIADIGRYTYRVVIVANSKGITRQKLFLLTGGFPAEVVDHQHCYSSLLFPLLSGNYYNADSLQLSLNLSNKNAGAKISYTVAAQRTNCEITVVFIPTIEIAKTMYKYRNAILKYNPRSYLGHEGHNVNAEIRRSIESRATNEFALFNNGITVLSDATYLNERIGQKDRAQLILSNPQIINGGQTAYTLSAIYRENLDGDYETLFAGKEVLVKIITFDSSSSMSESDKVALIEDISRATNQQTAVTAADRSSNELQSKSIQRRLFDRCGLFLERKRGEFEDGVREGYVKPADVIDRSHYWRATMASQGLFSWALRSAVAAKVDYKTMKDVSDSAIDRSAFAILLLRLLVRTPKGGTTKMGTVVFAKLYFAMCFSYKDGLTTEARDIQLQEALLTIDSKWEQFIRFVGQTDELEAVERNDGKKSKFRHYVISPSFKEDVRKFRTTIPEPEAAMLDGIENVIAEAERL